jgi:hypothetical protein
MAATVTGADTAIAVATAIAAAMATEADTAIAAATGDMESMAGVHPTGEETGMRLPGAVAADTVAAGRREPSHPEAALVDSTADTVAAVAVASTVEAVAASMAAVVEAAAFTAVAVGAAASMVVVVEVDPTVVVVVDTGKISVGSSQKARLLRQAGLFRCGRANEF